ncbi:arabinan endo-1,5-alpha-L-arabinosidase [Bacillus solitudinis]|uniref:arabinan endo-1,5-alpha-L-arabinosidase n=1 Tax=Bacillus solitudinis TaxID=2014074 RepID=UPI000C2443FE|nr:arabinan endo-1,5-alpha-L-arabinosidase [Bacillus solitudinis]
MKKRVIIITIVIISLFIGLFTYYGLNGEGNQLVMPAPPAEEPIPKVDTAIMHNESKWTTNNTHDGEIIKVDDWYYVFSTDYMVAGEVKPGIMLRKSPDLINWEFVGRVFDAVPEEAKEWTNGASIFWAPDVIEMNNTFYLYYSVSEFGTKNSYIGVATSSSIEGPWEDQGEVFKSKVGDDNQVNAIDSGIILDREGEPWMVFGSYEGGLFITELDQATGKLKDPGNQGTLVANKGSQNHQALEGPAIMYNADTDYFYLTVSYGWLEDTYNVRVGRSKEITGPYTDYNGNDLVDIETTTGSPDVGTKIVGSYAFNNDNGWQGTGHNGLLKDGDDYFLVHNARAGDDIYWSHLHVRKVLWTEDGWPAISPQRYAGEVEQKVTEKQLVGDWEKIVLDRLDDRMLSSDVLTLLPDGKIGDASDEDYWELVGENTLKLSYHAPGDAPDDYWVENVIVAPAWDWENWNETLIFTGYSQQFGEAIWGKKTVQ